MKLKSSRRLVARLGLALAVAAIAAPGAQAMTMNAMNESGGERPPLRGRSPRPARSRHSPAVERSHRRGFAAADRFELERSYRRGLVQAEPGPGLVLRVEHSHRRSFLGAAHRRSPQRAAQAQGAARPGADTVRVDATPIDRLAEHQLGRRRNRSGPRSARPDAPVRRRLLRRTTQPQRSARRHMSREPTVVSGLSRVGPLTTVRGALSAWGDGGQLSVMQDLPPAGTVTFFSRARIGCQVFQPAYSAMDLAALCIRP